MLAVKELTVKAWSHTCKKCNAEYDIEESDARMAPGVPLVVSDAEKPFVVLDHQDDVVPSMPMRFQPAQDLIMLGDDK